MPLKQLERFVTIRMTVVTVFVFATAFTAAIAIGLQYFFSRELASEAAADLYATTSSSVASELESIGKLNRNVVELLADNPELADPSLEDKLLPLFTQVLERNPLTYGIYVGRRDGSLFEVINLDSSRKARDALDALHSDRWVVMRVDEVQGLRQRRYQYLDSTLRVRAERTEATDYDATKRPWYEAAIASGEAETSQPYLFAQLGAAGRTVSKRVINSESVVGLDLTLETMSAFLRQHEASRDSTIYLYDARGTVIASSKPVAAEAESDLPAPRISLSTAEREYLASLGTLKVSNETDWPPFDYAVQGQPRGYAIDMVRMIGESLDVPLDFVNGLSWPELVAQFRQGDIDILHPISLTAETRDWGLSGTPYLNLPFALLTRDQENPPKKLATLSGKRLAIPSGYVVTDVIAEQWPEIKIVVAESPRDAVELVLNGEADAALDKYAMLQYISENYFISGVSIHSDIGTGMKDVPRDMYLLSPADEPELRTLIDRVISAIGSKQLDYLHTKWLDYSEAGSGRVAEVVPGQLTAIASNPVQQDRLVSGVITGTDYLMYASKLGPEDGAPMVGIITPTSTVMAPFLEKVTYSIGITAGLLILLLPLSWVFADPIVRPIRQLARENDKVRQLRFDEVQRVPSRIKELDELSGSMVAMVASIQAHERAQRELMDAFIRLRSRINRRSMTSDWIPRTSGANTVSPPGCTTAARSQPPSISWTKARNLRPYITACMKYACDSRCSGVTPRFSSFETFAQTPAPRQSCSRNSKPSARVCRRNSPSSPNATSAVNTWIRKNSNDCTRSLPGRVVPPTGHAQRIGARRMRRGERTLSRSAGQRRLGDL